MNLLADPGFEAGGSWVYTGLGATVSSPVRTGAAAARLTTRQGVIGQPNGTSTVTSEQVAVVPGGEYAVSGYYNAEQAMADADLILAVDPGDGVFSTLWTLDPAAAATPGWHAIPTQSWVAVGTAAQVRLRSGPTALGVANDRWFADDMLLEAVSDMAVAKHLAHAGLITALKGINGAGGGFYNDLANRVYSRLVVPGQQIGVTLPYLCAPLSDELETYEHGATYTSGKFTVRIHGFVSETSASRLDCSAAELVAKLHDDVWRALTNDLTLGGTVRDLTVTGCNSWSGIDDNEARYGELLLTVELHQIWQRSDLGV